MDHSRLDAATAALDTIHRRMDAAGICDCGGRSDAEVRTDPPVSEAQRRAMRAAAGGNSNLGISKKVGEEFSSADPGGKLPETKK